MKKKKQDRKQTETDFKADHELQSRKVWGNRAELPSGPDCYRLQVKKKSPSHWKMFV